MFREMRRKRQQLSDEKCIDILKKCTSGVLAVSGDDGYPYAVPLSYVYDNGKIYFHCAKQGHKLDAIVRNEKVSFCIIEQDHIMPDKFTTYYRSVIVFGRARIPDSREEIFPAIRKLSEKYSPDKTPEEHNAEIERFRNTLCMIELTIEHITGKESIELVEQ